MVSFSHDKPFNGTCAPFVYIAGCSKEARHALMIESRVWLAIFSLGFLSLLTAVIYRFTRVQEKFNTLRLILLLYLSGAPLYVHFLMGAEPPTKGYRKTEILLAAYIVYDAIRGTSETAHGVPPHIMGFLWWGAVIPGMSVFVVMTVTYITFSSSNVLVRSPLAANPALYWGLQIPFLVFSIVLPLVSGINYWYYFVATRICFSSWAAFLFILCAISAYFGKQTLGKLKAAGDTFNYNQQLRLLLFLLIGGLVVGVLLGVQGFFLDSIDARYQIFILCTSFYRFASFVAQFGGSAYVWYAASHSKKLSSGSLKSTQSQTSKRSRGTQTNTTHDTDSSTTDDSTDSDQNDADDERV